MAAMSSPAHETSWALHQVFTRAAPADAPACSYPHSSALTLPSQLRARAETCNFSQTAILFRRRKSGRALQKVLRAAGVPFNRHTVAPHRLGGVRDAVAALTVIAARCAERAAAAQTAAAPDAPDTLANRCQPRQARTEVSAVGGGGAGNGECSAPAPARCHALRPAAVASAKLRCLRAFLQKDGALKPSDWSHVSEVRLALRLSVCGSSMRCNHTQA